MCKNGPGFRSSQEQWSALTIGHWEVGLGGELERRRKNGLKQWRGRRTTTSHQAQHTRGGKERKQPLLKGCGKDRAQGRATLQLEQGRETFSVKSQRVNTEGLQTMRSLSQLFNPAMVAESSQRLHSNELVCLCSSRIWLTDTEIWRQFPHVTEKYSWFFSMI